jgi:hypothetical protein
MSINLLLLISELNDFLWAVAVNEPNYEKQATGLMRKLRKVVDQEREADLEQMKQLNKQFGNERNN